MILALAGLLALIQVEATVPVEHPLEAADRIRQLCPAASPRDRDRLNTLERRLTDLPRGQEPAPQVWTQLGCVHALLALNATLDRDDLISRGIKGSEAEGALRELMKAHALRPDDTTAAALLAVLSQSLTAGPTSARSAMLLDDLAIVMRQAVLDGMTSPDILRACTRLQISVGDIATARACSARALQLGSDSTWHLLRLARVSFADGDFAAGGDAFRRAAMSAHDSSAMNELLYPFFVEANWRRWTALRQDERAEWIADSLLPPEDSPSRTFMARVADQLDEFTGSGGRSHFWWCWRSVPGNCAQPGGKGETVIHTAAQLTHFWNAETAEPVALITYGLRNGDLVSSRDSGQRVAAVNTTIHLWDETTGWWSDTTITQQLAFPTTASPGAFAIGRIVLPTSAGVSSWSLRVWQAENRRGRAADDQHTPLGTGPLQLSDLIVESAPANAKVEEKGTEFVPALFGYVKRSRPVKLFFQLRSDQDRPELRVYLTARREQDGVVQDTLVLNDSYALAAQKGISELAPDIPIGRFSPGTYRLRILITDETNSTFVRRETVMIVE